MKRTALALALMSSACLAVDVKPSHSETVRIREMARHLVPWDAWRWDRTGFRGTFKVTVYRKTKEDLDLFSDIDLNLSRSESGHKRFDALICSVLPLGKVKGTSPKNLLQDGSTFFVYGRSREKVKDVGKLLGKDSGDFVEAYVTVERCVGQERDYCLDSHRWSGAGGKGSQPAYWLVDVMPAAKFESVVKVERDDFTAWE